MESIRCTDCERRFWTTSASGMAERGIACEDCGGSLVPVGRAEAARNAVSAPPAPGPVAPPAT